MRAKRIYVASSWRNVHQPEVVTELRKAGHLVYDFRNPPGSSDFSWREVDPNWQNWDFKSYVEGLDHPIAQQGFESDMTALSSCDACILVLPCGRSAHLELGWAVGASKHTAIYHPPGISVEPELMAKMVDLQAQDMRTLKSWLEVCSDTDDYFS